MSQNQQQLLQKYLAGQCNRAELEELLNYLQNHPEGEAHQDTIQNLWQELHDTQTLTQEQSEELYQQISDRLPRQQVSAPWKIAASIGGVLLGLLLVYSLWINGEVTQMAGFAETRTIVLPDQSTVVLNGNSSVRYDRQWDSSAPRQVWLEGEAYFSVQHLANDQSFTVYTDNLVVEVLGTEFNVQSRRGATQVTLDAGKVKLNGLGATATQFANVILQPGEQATLTEQQNFVLTTVETAPVTAWRNHELIFNETPLSEVAHTIEDLYGHPVIIASDSIRQLKLTGTLPNNDMNTLLALLSEIFGIQATEEEGKIQLRE
ncbi:FecR family protein [Tunicatimonas pelagia]|uniref:FecR family protein n=1 Tax=Tunicatimonas pelagia TaxID=931531 RepID=UPI0026656E30|nr:FecR domain-containing protein [Tunicatimonas pelagia]WKN43674.1 FecR domain-containing protein [Tunicatimonas pelagia]